MGGRGSGGRGGGGGGGGAAGGGSSAPVAGDRVTYTDTQDGLTASGTVTRVNTNSVYVQWDGGLHQRLQLRWFGRNGDGAGGRFVVAK